MKRFLFCCLLIGGFLILTGFSIDHAIVPKDEILSGGVPKDGIPALLKPRFVHPRRASFVKPADEVIGVELDGSAKAYPIKILNWHEVVNDSIDGSAIVITF
jgi:hypothetical protein